MSVYRYSKLAHGYLGNADRTESGKQCVLWNNTVFVEFYGLKASNFPDKEIPGAVCRNPQDQSLNKLGLTDKGPWCFTNYIEDSTYMDTCDLPLRGQLKSSQKVESGKYVREVLIFNQYLWVSITYMPNEKLNIFMRDFFANNFFLTNRFATSSCEFKIEIFFVCVIRIYLIYPNKPTNMNQKGLFFIYSHIYI